MDTITQLIIAFWLGMEFGSWWTGKKIKDVLKAVVDTLKAAEIASKLTKKSK